MMDIKNSLIAATCTPALAYSFKEALIRDQKLHMLREIGIYPTNSAAVKMALIFFFESKISNQKIQKLYEMAEDNQQFSDFLSQTGKEIGMGDSHQGKQKK